MRPGFRSRCAPALQPAILPLRNAHAQGDIQGVGQFVGIVGVDDQRRPELPRRAREFGQDQHAGILGILGCDILLRHQIHAVPQGRDEANPRLTQCNPEIVLRAPARATMRSGVQSGSLHWLLMAPASRSTASRKS